MKPWKRGTWTAIRTDHDRFNWATAMKPWKSYVELGETYTYFTLQWGHGDEAVEEDLTTESVDPVHQRFNGATAMKPWKSTHKPKSSLAI